MLAKLSILGLYQYDPTIFDPLTLPGELSKDDFIALVMQECAELATTFPNPDVFKYMIGAFSRRHGNSWARIYAAMTAQYNPIENYDRHEDYTDNRNGTSQSSSGDTTTSKATAFNSDSFKDTEQAVSNGTANATSAETLVHAARIHGNIGVTTSQQMIREELEIRHNTVYSEILRDFMDVFVVGLY